MLRKLLKVKQEGALDLRLSTCPQSRVVRTLLSAAFDAPGFRVYL